MIDTFEDDFWIVHKETGPKSYGEQRRASERTALLDSLKKCKDFLITLDGGRGIQFNTTNIEAQDYVQSINRIMLHGLKLDSDIKGKPIDLFLVIKLMDKPLPPPVAALPKALDHFERERAWIRQKLIDGTLTNIMTTFTKASPATLYYPWGFLMHKPAVEELIEQLKQVENFNFSFDSLEDPIGFVTQNSLKFYVHSFPSSYNADITNTKIISTNSQRFSLKPHTYISPLAAIGTGESVIKVEKKNKKKRRVKTAVIIEDPDAFEDNSEGYSRKNGTKGAAEQKGHTKKDKISLPKDATKEELEENTSDQSVSPDPFPDAQSPAIETQHKVDDIENEDAKKEEEKDAKNEDFKKELAGFIHVKEEKKVEKERDIDFAQFKEEKKEEKERDIDFAHFKEEKKEEKERDIDFIHPKEEKKEEEIKGDEFVSSNFIEEKNEDGAKEEMVSSKFEDDLIRFGLEVSSNQFMYDQIHFDDEVQPSNVESNSSNPFEEEKQSNPFEDEKKSNSFEEEKSKKEVISSNPFEDEKQSNPFEDEKSSNPFEDEKPKKEVISSNPFEDEKSSNPFEEKKPKKEVLSSNPFEDEKSSNPFEEKKPRRNVSSKHFEEKKTSNPFEEEKKASNPFEDEKSSNPFEDEKPKKEVVSSNPFDEEKSLNPSEKEKPRRNVSSNPFEDEKPSNPFEEEQPSNPFEDEKPSKKEKAVINKEEAPQPIKPVAVQAKRKSVEKRSEDSSSLSPVPSQSPLDVEETLRKKYEELKLKSNSLNEKPVSKDPTEHVKEDDKKEQGQTKEVTPTKQPSNNTNDDDDDDISIASVFTMYIKGSVVIDDYESEDKKSTPYEIAKNRRYKMQRELAEQRLSIAPPDWVPEYDKLNFYLFNKPEYRMKRGNTCYKCGENSTGVLFKGLKFCEYTGKYMCSKCMSGRKFVIPGRIVHDWDFDEYPINKASYEYLTKIYNDPIISITKCDPYLYKKVSELEDTRVLRKKLFYISDIILSCTRDNDGGSIHCKQLFRSLPKYYYKELDTYSLKDLVNHGKLMESLELTYDESIKHIMSCKECSSKGSICKICKNKKPVFLYEFQTAAACKCCSNVYHIACLTHSSCPVCTGGGGGGDGSEEQIN